LAKSTKKTTREGLGGVGGQRRKKAGGGGLWRGGKKHPLTLKKGTTRECEKKKTVLGGEGHETKRTAGGRRDKGETPKRVFFHQGGLGKSTGEKNNKVFKKNKNQTNKKNELRPTNTGGGGTRKTEWDWKRP